MIDKTLIRKVRRDLHQIPEASLKEFKTSKYIENFLKKRGISYNYVTETGIIAFIEGKNRDIKIGLRADMDALEIKEENHFDFISKHNGYMHACGHDFHMSNLLGIIDYYSDKQPEISIIFIFQPAEEGAGGAKLMIENDLYNFYGKPDFIFGYHIKPDLKTGLISASPKEAWAGTLSIRISFLGDGGHGANPHKSQDLISIFSTWYLHIQNYISRKFNAQKSIVFTVGKIDGADRINIIPTTLEVEGMLRYFNNADKEFILKQIEDSAKSFTKLYGADAKIEIIRDAMPIINDETLFHSIKSFYDNQKLDSNYPTLQVASPVMLAEDFSEYLKDIRGVFFFLGVMKEQKQELHTPNLSPDEDALSFGVNFIINLIDNYQKWII